LIIRECEGADPYVIARYSFGVEKKALIENLSGAEVDQVVKDLVAMTNQVN
jgi:NADH dehydrogenase (ubiquinone) 1 alpha subcomplex subunit 2